MAEPLPIEPTDEPTTPEKAPSTGEAMHKLVAALAAGKVPVTDVPHAAGLTHARLVELMDDADAARHLAAYQWMMHWRERLMSENLRMNAMAGLTHIASSEKAGETERRACNDLLDFEPTPAPQRPTVENEDDRPMTAEELHRTAMEIFSSVGEVEDETGDDDDPPA